VHTLKICKKVGGSIYDCENEFLMASEDGSFKDGSFKSLKAVPNLIIVFVGLNICVSIMGFISVF
jgi:hypothetical protein